MSNFKKLSEARQFSPEKMKKNGMFETDRFFCDTYCFEPGQEQSLHTHGGQDKVYYVLEGKGVFTVGDEQRRARRRRNRARAGGTKSRRRQPQPGKARDSRICHA